MKEGITSGMLGIHSITWWKILPLVLRNEAGGLVLDGTVSSSFVDFSSGHSEVWTYNETFWAAMGQRLRGVF